MALLPGTDRAHPVEALWKHEGEGCGGCLRKAAWVSCRLKSTKPLKKRSKMSFCVILRSRSAATHNLKVVSSNLAPATKFAR